MSGLWSAIPEPKEMQKEAMKRIHAKRVAAANHRDHEGRGE
jgi:hypothetical protein